MDDFYMNLVFLHEQLQSKIDGNSMFPSLSAFYISRAFIVAWLSPISVVQFPILCSFLLVLEYKKMCLHILSTKGVDPTFTSSVM